MRERRLGSAVIAHIEAATPKNDVSGNVIRIIYQALLEHLTGPLQLPVLAVDLRQRCESGPLWILLPTALELVDLAGVSHPGPYA